MKKIIVILFLLVICGGGLFLFIYNFHLVKTKDGFHVFQKEKPGLAETYLNTEDWNVLDYARYPTISKSLISDSWESLSSQLEQTFSSFSEQIKSTYEDVEKQLENSDVALEELKKIQNNTMKEIEKLEKQLKSAETEKEIEQIKAKITDLHQWYEEHLQELKDQYL